MKNEEHNAQVAVIHWSFLERRTFPELELLHAVPNGGLRNIVTAKKLKAEGVKPGVPDLDLPVSRGPYHGLRIEMKSAKGSLSADQKWWRERLSEQGYLVIVCRDFKSATGAIMEYLAQPKRELR